jgi:hypothetical protein
MDASRLGLRDLRSPGGVMGGHCGAQKSKRVHGHEEDSVGQVKEEGDGKFE